MNTLAKEVLDHSHRYNSTMSRLKVVYRFITKASWFH